MTDFTPETFRKLAKNYHVASKESVALYQAADTIERLTAELAACREAAIEECARGPKWLTEPAGWVFEERSQYPSTESHWYNNFSFTKIFGEGNGNVRNIRPVYKRPLESNGTLKAITEKYADGFTTEVYIRMRLLADAASAATRNGVIEECALICDRVNNHDNPMTARDCADAIRQLKGQK